MTILKLLLATLLLGNAFAEITINDILAAEENKVRNETGTRLDYGKWFSSGLKYVNCELSIQNERPQLSGISNDPGKD